MEGRTLGGVFLLAVGCNGHPLAEVSLTRNTEWVAGRQCTRGPAKVDVLFVVDDSGSMADQAEALAENLQGFGAAYDESGLDFRLAVTTTHVPSPDCEEGRGDGVLVPTSCRERIHAFAAAASHEGAAADVRSACLEHCELDDVAISPTLVEGDPLARPRPWLQRSREGSNFGSTAASEALACIGQVGISGCNAESPIGAALRALERMSDPRDASYGFLRPDAGLAIMFIGDEDDCSRAEGAVMTLGGDDRTLSAACWNAGTHCETRDGVTMCEPAEATSLLPLDAFLERLHTLETQKQSVARTGNQRVFVSAVAGVPGGWSSAEQQVFTTDDSAFAAAFGIGPGCQENGRTAAPPVRLREVVEEFDPWLIDLTSSCSEDWLLALSCVPSDGPGPHRGRVWPFCLDVDVLDDRSSAGLEASCSLTETREGEIRRLPSCQPACEDVDCKEGPTTWAIPEGVEACVAWLGPLATQQRCVDEGQAEVRILQRAEEWRGSCLEVRCAAAF